ncbi:helix-turn-helix domain-containing protein [Pseudomonas marginalis]|uniref:helix-turn-helix domain-containing protein n=1 Tax=Pseudomonas marginalis TaxID=298 RepID=UPI003B00522C
MGRKATAREKSQEIIELVERGLSKPDISRQLSIGITSIYRIIRENRPDLLEKR